MDIRVAISQKPPVLLDLEATYQPAIETIAEAAGYSRPDIFRLEVERRPKPPAEFLD
jgi:hypothetical protein